MKSYKLYIIALFCFIVSNAKTQVVNMKVGFQEDVVHYYNDDCDINHISTSVVFQLKALNQNNENVLIATIPIVENINKYKLFNLNDYKEINIDINATLRAKTLCEKDLYIFPYVKSETINIKNFLGLTDYQTWVFLNGVYDESFRMEMKADLILSISLPLPTPAFYVKSSNSLPPTNVCPAEKIYLSAVHDISPNFSDAIGYRWKAVSGGKSAIIAYRKDTTITGQYLLNKLGLNQKASVSLYFEAYNKLSNVVFFTQSTTFEINTPPPTAVIEKFPVCADGSSGGVLIKSINAINGMETLFRCGEGYFSGYVENINDPKLGFTDLFDTIPSTLIPLSNKWYTFIFGYRDSINNRCVSSIPIWIPKLPKPTITPSAITHETCYEANDGSLKASVSGGYLWGLSIECVLSNGTNVFSIPYTFETKWSSDMPDWVSTEKIFTFSNLPPGKYELKVKHANSVCEELYADSISIIKIPKLTQKSFTKVNPTCIAVPDGSLTFEVNGGKPYKYFILYKNENSSWIEKNRFETTNTTHTFSGLTEGNYKIEVSDSCFNDKVILDNINLSAVTPLKLTSEPIQPLDCYGNTNGQLSVTASGGSGFYKIELGSEIKTSIPATFNHLKGDTLYTLWLTNNNSTCPDKTSLAVTIPQPARINVTLADKGDVTCKGSDDGWLKVAALGGSGAFTSYNWTLKTVGDIDYKDYFKTTDSIAKLEPALYRCLVKDSNNCMGESQPIEIREPSNALAFDSVIFNNVVCFGENAFCKPMVSGGWNCYAYTFTQNNQTVNPEVMPDNRFRLTNGAYVLAVTDSNKCTVVYPITLQVTSPDSPLEMTFDTVLLSNGHHISCFGNTDGQLTIQASGGNGANYSGYTYFANALTNFTGQFKNLPAGVYSFYARDARGCQTAAQQVQLTQPASVLSVSIDSVTPVTCAGMAQGGFRVNALGGSMPFTYSLNQLDWTDKPLFDQLPKGNYRVYARDVMGCTDTAGVSVPELYPPIELTAQLANVSCYGLSDGAISLTSQGGLAPYRYTWSHAAEAKLPTANGLRAGTYSVTVSDSVDCTLVNQYTLTQPSSLGLSLQPKPLCPGSRKGNVTVFPAGGTPPYQYSLNQGGWTSINPLEADTGLHTLQIRDVNNCLAQAQTRVEQRTLEPQLSFMAATALFDSDTLALIENSQPTPDSLDWDIQTSAELLSEGETPLLRFTTNGTLEVTLTGYFSGCDYSETKLLYISPGDSIFFDDDLQPQRGIESVSVSPNPVLIGTATMNLTLYEKQNVYLCLIGVNGTVLLRKHYNQVDQVEETFTFGPGQKGNVLLNIQTPYDVRNVLILVK